MKRELSHDRLINLLEYSPWTGHFYWKVDRGTGKNQIKGKKAGCLVPKGYINIKIDNKLYRAQNLAWFYIMEEWPINQIDHIDQIKNNNKFFNLREATDSENQANKGLQKNNTTGYKGVTWSKIIGKYRTIITKNKKRYHLGYFDCHIEAAKAYDKKAREFFGPFAVLNFPNRGMKC